MTSTNTPVHANLVNLYVKGQEHISVSWIHLARSLLLLCQGIRKSIRVKVKAHYCSSNPLWVGVCSLSALYSVILSIFNSAELSSSRHARLQHVTRFTPKCEDLFFWLCAVLTARNQGNRPYHHPV